MYFYTVYLCVHMILRAPSFADRLTFFEVCTTAVATAVANGEPDLPLPYDLGDFAGGFDDPVVNLFGFDTPEEFFRRHRPDQLPGRMRLLSAIRRTPQKSLRGEMHHEQSHTIPKLCKNYI